MLVTTETLAKMFEANTDKTHMFYTDRCRSCGRSITIEIHYLSSGYGLLGGAMFEEGPSHLTVTCESCLQAKPQPIQ